MSHRLERYYVLIQDTELFKKLILLRMQQFICCAAMQLNPNSNAV